MLKNNDLVVNRDDIFGKNAIFTYQRSEFKEVIKKRNEWKTTVLSDINLDHCLLHNQFN